MSHQLLVEMIEAGDAERFAAAMAQHIDEIESELVLEEPPPAAMNLATVFRT